MDRITELLDDLFGWIDDFAWRMTNCEVNQKWRRTFRVLPKRSPEGRIVWGLCWKRHELIPTEMQGMMTHRITIIYAHGREMFKDTLKEGTK